MLLLKNIILKVEKMSKATLLVSQHSASTFWADLLAQIYYIIHPIKSLLKCNLDILISVLVHYWIS